MTTNKPNPAGIIPTHRLLGDAGLHTHNVRVDTRPSAKNVQPLPVTDVKALLATALVYKHGYLVPMFTLSLFAGLRLVEIERLTWGNIDLNAGMVTIHGDGPDAGPIRVVPLPPNTGPWLAPYTNESLMPRLWRDDFASIVKRAGLNIEPVALRYTGIAYALKLIGDAPATTCWSDIAASTLHRLHSAPLDEAEVLAYWNLTPASVSGCWPVLRASSAKRPALAVPATVLH